MYECYRVQNDTYIFWINRNPHIPTYQSGKMSMFESRKKLPHINLLRLNLPRRNLLSISVFGTSQQQWSLVGFLQRNWKERKKPKISLIKWHDIGRRWSAQGKWMTVLVVGVRRSRWKHTHSAFVLIHVQNINTDFRIFYRSSVHLTPSHPLFFSLAVDTKSFISMIWNVIAKIVIFLTLCVTTRQVTRAYNNVSLHEHHNF